MTNRKEQTIQIHVKDDLYLSIHQSFSGRQETMAVLKRGEKTTILGDTPKDVKDAKDIVNDIMSIMMDDFSIWSALSEEHDQYYEEEMQ